MCVEGGDGWCEEGERVVRGVWLRMAILWCVCIYCGTWCLEVYRYKSEVIAALDRGCEQLRSGEKRRFFVGLTHLVGESAIRCKS